MSEVRTHLPATTLQPVVARGLSVAFGGRSVLRGVDLVVPPGRRTGLVGENGSGKSTLLRALAGRLAPRAHVGGEVSVPHDTALLGQEPPFPEDASVGAVLASTLRPLRTLVEQVEELASRLAGGEAVGDTYGTVLDRAVALDAWDADRRATLAAARLGLDGLDPDRRVDTLSGGQRTRLALAALMTTRPSAVLLDEPTNHLDDDALEVLAEFLRGLPGVVLLASHDRVLLDEVCTDLVDIEPGELGTDGSGGMRFGGGWSAYEEHRAEARRRWEETWTRQQEEIERLRRAAQVDESGVAHGRGPRDNDKFIHAFKGANVERTVARRRRDVARRLAEAESSQVRRPRAPLRFSAPLTGTGGGGSVAQVRDLLVGDSATPRLQLDRLDLAAGEHLLVTGSNGAGKSTLLGVLAGRLQAAGGTVDVRARRVAELAQDVVLLDPARSPLEVYAAVVAGLDGAPDLRELGLLHPRDLGRPAGLLSVGQRRRLGLALALATSPDLLLLDEPTNHLSLALVGELEEAIGTAAGTVVLASHDRWLRRRWSGRELRLG